MSNLLPELLPSNMKDETMDRTRLRTREAMQDLILRSLSESGFSDVAVFHGGTCLRKLYGLNRLSEDLDFSLIIPRLEFDFEAHLKRVIATFGDERLELQAKVREARGELPIFSVMYGVNFRNILKMAGFSESVISSVHRDELIRVKMDVDTNPPSYRRDGIVHRDWVVSYDVRTEELPVLYAGKMSAVLCRQWKHRVKGRDLFDYVWYIERGTPLDMRALESRLDKKCRPTSDLDRDVLIEMLDRRFDSLDLESAKDDVRGFLFDDSCLDLWSPEYFKDLAREIVIEG